MTDDGRFEDMSDIQAQVAKCRQAAIMFREEMARLVDITKHQCALTDQIVHALSGTIPEPTIDQSAAELVGVAELVRQLEPRVPTIPEKPAEVQPTNGLEKATGK